MATPSVNITPFSCIPPSQKEIYEAAKAAAKAAKRKAYEVNDNNDENPSKVRKVLFRKPFPNLEVLDMVHPITEYSGVEKFVRNASSLDGRNSIRYTQVANGEYFSKPFPGF